METTRLFRQSLPGRAELAWDHVVVGEGLPEDQDLAQMVLGFGQARLVGCPSFPPFRQAWQLTKPSHQLHLDDLLAQMEPAPDRRWVLEHGCEPYHHGRMRGLLERGLASLDMGLRRRQDWLAAHREEGIYVLWVNIFLFDAKQYHDCEPMAQFPDAVRPVEDAQGPPVKMLVPHGLAESLRPRQLDRPERPEQCVFGDRALRPLPMPDWMRSGGSRVLILGSPGSGKSVLAGMRLRSALSRNIPVLHLDAGNDGGRLAHGMTGFSQHHRTEPLVPDPIRAEAGPLVQEVFGYFLGGLMGLDEQVEDRMDLFEDVRRQEEVPDMIAFTRGLLFQRTREKGPERHGDRLARLAGMVGAEAYGNQPIFLSMSRGKFLANHATRPWLSDIVLALEIANFLDFHVGRPLLIAIDEAHRFLLGEHLPRLLDRLLREGRKQRKHVQIVTQSEEDLPPNWAGLMSGICRPVGVNHEFLLEGGHVRTVIRARPGKQEWQALNRAL